MSSGVITTATQRRKGNSAASGPPGGNNGIVNHAAPSSSTTSTTTMETVATASMHSGSSHVVTASNSVLSANGVTVMPPHSSMPNSPTGRRKIQGMAELFTLESSTSSTAIPTAEPLRATVKRRLFGTGPFDHYWLNVDCCGILCALVTYGLHFFACFVVCTVLIPPWMSVTAPVATVSAVATTSVVVRSMTAWGYFHTTTFCAIAAMAIVSHFQAMTTDPGAVPPDARPLEEERPESNERATTDDPLIPTHVPVVRRICRRCKAFKPARAHHCSVCNRCIIKMDHHCTFFGTRPVSLSLHY
jgi:hypothetical protein